MAVVVDLHSIAWCRRNPAEDDRWRTDGRSAERFLSGFKLPNANGPSCCLSHAELRRRLPLDSMLFNSQRRVQSVVMIMSVCLSIFLFVCLLAYVRPDTHLQRNQLLLLPCRRFQDDNLIAYFFSPSLTISGV